MVHPNDIKPENIVGVISYVGDSKEFRTFAKDLAIKKVGTIEFIASPEGV